MIIKASKCDREYLEKQLLNLIEEYESELFHANHDEIHSGIATFSESLSVNRALMNRAIEKIRNAVQMRTINDRIENNHRMDVGYEYLARQEEEERMDSIGPELLSGYIKDSIPF